MVETSHLREFYNLSHLGRLNGPRLRCVFAQPQVSAAVVIIFQIASQDLSQMPFCLHDHMIQAVAPD
jgi:hypothetical protein